MLEAANNRQPSRTANNATLRATSRPVLLVPILIACALTSSSLFLLLQSNTLQKAGIEDTAPDIRFLEPAPAITLTPTTHTPAPLPSRSTPAPSSAVTGAATKRSKKTAPTTEVRNPTPRVPIVTTPPPPGIPVPPPPPPLPINLPEPVATLVPGLAQKSYAISKPLLALSTSLSDRA